MENTNKPLVYLATPYSYKHEDKAVKDAKEIERFERANKIGAMLTKEGYTIFSPISMAHPMNQYGLPGNWEFWAKFDEAFISCCYKMFVICADGWLESVGVKAELKLAKKYNIPVTFLDAEGNPLDTIVKLTHTTEDGRWETSEKVRIHIEDLLDTDDGRYLLKTLFHGDNKFAQLIKSPTSRGLKTPTESSSGVVHLGADDDK